MMDKQLTMFDIEVVESFSARRCIDELRLRAKYQDRVFYSPRDVAGLLHLSYFQVFQAIRFYRLDAVRVGLQWRIPFNAIIRYIEERSYRSTLEEAYYKWLAARGA